MIQDGETSDLTPLMKQYYELKAQVPDAHLFFRMGDFYELFGADAVSASKLLGITLTSRDKNKSQPMPMAGFPHHSAEPYIQKLLKLGHKVAIGEQMEDPALAKAGKTIVRREIVRVLTPAVQFNHEGMESSYLATLVASDDQWVLACLDASTGDLRISAPCDSEMILSELSQLPIRHLLVHHDLPVELRNCFESSARTVLVEELALNYLNLDQAREGLLRQFELATLDSFFSNPASIWAAGILVAYVLKTQKIDRLLHLKLPTPLHSPQTLVLGPHTPAHLDLVSDEGADLFALINQTKSALGSRTLKRWLLEPLKTLPGIQGRQDSIRELGENPRMRNALGASLAQIYDVERIMGRIAAGSANPRDTLALAKSLSTLTQITETLGACQTTGLGAMKNSLASGFERIKTTIERVLLRQKEEAPFTAREGGIFNTGADSELDRLISLTQNGEKWLIDLEQRERRATQIPSLKVRFNRVFGYYIEITSAHLSSVPEHYQRKQTMVGAERFFTEELKKFEEEILSASSRQKSLESSLFDALLGELKAISAEAMEIALSLGELDALVSLSQWVGESGWIFPTLDESLELEIEGGRHPLVDQSMKGKFVPNATSFHREQNILLITGPNMGGKSTVMRQTALIVILGQMGAPVPATRARWGIFESIYTRIGAQDAISRGQSTFMVEMSELAHILHHADSRSLLVLDEIGRGTSTYDGISVAWASLEWISRKIKSRTLFATHYHELTRLEASLPGIKNVHMAVEATRAARGGGSLRFLYLLRNGPAAESFGIHVAKLAGMPQSVVDRAWEVLEDLEQGTLAAPAEASPQLSLFEQPATAAAQAPAVEPAEWVNELSSANLNEMTPVQALNFLVRIQGEASRANGE